MILKCIFIRDIYTGITTSEHTLIRILVGRSEIDLGDIVQYFAEEFYGEGRTLKYWIKHALKGSFRTSLLRIADVTDDLKDPDSEDPDEHEFQWEFHYRSPRLRREPLIPSAAVPMVLDSKCHVSINDDLYTNHFSDNENPSPEKNCVYNNQWNGNNAFDGLSSEKPAFYIQDDIKIVVSRDISPALPDDMDEHKSYDPYDVNEKDFGKFIEDKINEKTAKRLF